ncbi:MAG: cation:proton antiporter domain-containing protein, partial [Thermodesulfobacteriota bacterium]
DSPHGRTAFGILIFQDIVVVPMMLVTPLLAGGRGESGPSVLILLAEAAAMVVMAVVSAKWVVPWSLYQVARTKSRELFLLSVLTICMAVAWLTSTLGLSLALGAFLAGLIISESEYSHQTLGNILPFRDVFMSFFFVSVGMLLDVRYLLQQPALILLVAFGLLLLKAVIACLTTGLMGFPIRTIILTGLALSQVGEFSFILSRVGLNQGLLSEEMYPLFLAVSVLTMAATPLVMALAPYIAEAISHLPMPSRLKSGLDSGEGEAVVGLKDHLVIIGFGVNGRNLARAAKAVGIPYAVIEINPETARVERGRGEPMIYGDATQVPVLLHAHVGEARTVVVAINDPAATRRITEAVRSLAPSVHLIVRTRYLQEMRPLYDLGADEVIPEEFETSVEIFARVMKQYLIPRDEIERLILEVRSGGYEMFRNLALDPATICDLDRYLHGIEISTLRVEESSAAAGRSLAEMELRKRHGVTVVAIRRGGEMLVDPDADEKMMANDILVVLGMPERLAGALPLFRSQGPQRADQSSVIGR